MNPTIDMTAVLALWMKENHPDMFTSPCHTSHPKGCDGLFVVIGTEPIVDNMYITGDAYHFLIEIDFMEKFGNAISDTHEVFIVNPRGVTLRKIVLHVADPEYFNKLNEFIILAKKIKNENFQVVS